MNILALELEAHHYRLLRERLLTAFPDVDDQTIRDTLEGLTTLHELVAEVIRSALIDAALKAGLRGRLEEMKARLARLELRESKKRELVLEVMTEAGLKKLEQPDFTLSVRSGVPALVVVAENDIPDNYWLPQPARLDRQAVLHDLKCGAQVPGAQISNPKPALNVRTK
jgi:hypothetical protein